MAEARRNRSRSVAGALLDEVLSTHLRQWQSQRAFDDYAVTDLGGGTGTLAITLAEAGHPVTVIDPSLDALASLQRRIAEQQLGDRLRGVQGDSSELLGLVGADSTDLMVCHRTLEMIDEPSSALAAMAEVVRPDGALSLVVPQRRAAVLSQALQGHISAALQALDDPARFDLEDVVALVEQAGFRIVEISGIGTLATHVPQAALESEPGLVDQLYELESKISKDAAFRAIAPWAHIFALR